jgi:molecular chaperone HscB
MPRVAAPLLADVVLQHKTRAARDLSGLVNKAYSTLLRPLSRIHYILSQHNLSVSETDQLDDPHLITEVIEVREALEDASSDSEVDEIKNDVVGSRKFTHPSPTIS